VVNGGCNRLCQFPDTALGDELGLELTGYSIQGRLDGCDGHTGEYVVENLELEAAADLLWDQGQPCASELFAEVIDKAAEYDPGKPRLQAGKKRLGHCSNDMELDMMLPKEPARGFEQPLQVHLFGDPGEGADDDRTSRDGLVQNAAALLPARIAGRKNDVHERRIDVIESSAILLRQRHEQVAGARQMLFGEPRFPCILFEQSLAKQIAIEIARDLVGNPGLEVMRHVHQDRMIAGNLLDVIKGPAHAVLIEHDDVVVIRLKFLLECFPILFGGKSC